MAKWTTAVRIVFVAIALTASVAACAGDSEVIGVRGAAGIGNPIFPWLGNGGYDVSHYDIELNYDPDAPALAGVANIRAKATENLLAFNFDFAGLTINAVEVNDEPATFSREDFELTIEPATIIPDGSNFTVRVTYGGTPGPIVLPGFPIPVGWIRIRDTLVVIGGPSAYPSNGTASDRATYNLRMTVPKPLVVSATGNLTATIDNGETSTYVWELTTPSGSSFGPIGFTVSDAELESIPGPDGLTINNYFPPGLPRSARDRLDIAAEIIELFSELFGPFPYDSFGFTYLQERFSVGGYAPPQRVFLFIPDERKLGERGIAHEISHQWFGNSSTPASLSDSWLAEGFATYAELLWVEHTDGAAAYITEAQALRTFVGERTRPVTEFTSPTELLDAALYLRGGLTLHALRLELGDEDFFEVLRTYVERFRQSAVSTADFIAVAEEVSQQDLGEFFDDWLYSEPVPPLDK